MDEITPFAFPYPYSQNNFSCWIWKHEKCNFYEKITEEIKEGKQRDVWWWSYYQSIFTSFLVLMIWWLTFSPQIWCISVHVIGVLPKWYWILYQTQPRKIQSNSMSNTLLWFILYDKELPNISAYDAWKDSDLHFLST